VAEKDQFGVITHEDGLQRCGWPGASDDLYICYHDTDWGVPEYDDRALWEKLILDGFQAGLSWITILRKRDAFREAFDGFNPEIIVTYDEHKYEELMNNAGIVRNKAKIRASITNAKSISTLWKNRAFRNICGIIVAAHRSRTTLSPFTRFQQKQNFRRKSPRTLKSAGSAFVAPPLSMHLCKQWAW